MLKRMAMVALLSVSLAGAKTYTITLTEPCQAGGAQLKAGQYTVKLEGNKVVLIDKARRSIETAAKVETADRKYDRTAITISKADGSNRLRSITLAGSKSRVVFE